MATPTKEELLAVSQAALAASKATRAAAAAARGYGKMGISATLVAAASAIESVSRLLAPADHAVVQEVAIRAAASRPVLEEQVRAASDGRPPALSGTARAGRNVATHCELGCGPGKLQQMLAAPKAAQRSGRRARRRRRCSPTASPPSTQSPVPVSTASGSGEDVVEDTGAREPDIYDIFSTADGTEVGDPVPDDVSCVSISGCIDVEESADESAELSFAVLDDVENLDAILAGDTSWFAQPPPTAPAADVPGGADLQVAVQTRVQPQQPRVPDIHMQATMLDVTDVLKCYESSTKPLLLASLESAYQSHWQMQLDIAADYAMNNYDFLSLWPHVFEMTSLGGQPAVSLRQRRP